MEHKVSSTSCILINKPYGWSSFDVVKKVRNVLRIKKVGHAGTLDPMATGLLIILLNNGTKQFAEYQQYQKEYIAEITFGSTTDTYDKEGQQTSYFPESFSLNASTILDALQLYTGTFEQIPPVYSAIKVGGKPAYQRVRKGESIELPSKEVTVYSAELISVSHHTIRVKYIVSSGTYIRSLAHELGKHLGYGAHLSGLVRTVIGPYRLEDALSIESLKNHQA